MPDLYHDHIEAKAKLKFWKEKELEIRNEILEEMECEKLEGTVSKKVGDLKIKATFKLNRKIDDAGLNLIYKDLSDEEKEAIKFKPEVVTKKIKELEEEGSSKLLDIIELKPAQGSIEITQL